MNPCISRAEIPSSKDSITDKKNKERMINTNVFIITADLFVYVGVKFTFNL